MSEKRILCIGICCLDIVTVTASFPKEDSKQRSLDYYWQRGGNASNSSSALAMLGANVEFMGILVRGLEYGFLERDFLKFGIKTDNCVILEEGQDKCSTAIVVINKQNGSRTIVASISRSEVKFEDFDSRINLKNYKWIHIEGRANKDNMQKMMEKIALFNSKHAVQEKIKVSLELEKVKCKELIDLMQYVDFTFISKEMAAGLGHKTKEETVKQMVRNTKPGGSVICAWGEDGAAGKCRSCDTVTSTIFPPETVVDTLAAGDTFNAAAIFALADGKDLKDAITFGCKVAGAKCGMHGTVGLKGFEQYL